MKNLIFCTSLFALLLGCTERPSNAGGTTHFANKTDYICGMEVMPGFTDTCSYNGKTYAFCSPSCKETFLKEPEKYLALPSDSSTE